MAAFKRPAIIKLAELVIMCVLLGLQCHSNTARNVGVSMLTMGTFGGYLIILIGLVIAIIMDTPVNRRVDLFWSVLGVILFVIVGALSISDFHSIYGQSTLRDIGLAKGSIAIIGAAVFLADAFITFRGD